MVTTVGNEYAIAASAAQGSGLSNYSICYAAGKLTVTAKDLLITASDRTKTYGDAVVFAGSEFTSDGLVRGDEVTSVK